MVKSCWAYTCETQSSRSIYRSPADMKGEPMWVATMKRQAWEHTLHSWLCTNRFLCGSKNNSRLTQHFMLLIFSHIRSTQKLNKDRDVHADTKRKETQIHVKEVTWLIKQNIQNASNNIGYISVDIPNVVWGLMKKIVYYVVINKW